MITAMTKTAKDDDDTNGDDNDNIATITTNNDISNNTAMDGKYELLMESKPPSEMNKYTTNFQKEIVTIDLVHCKQRFPGPWTSHL